MYAPQIQQLIKAFRRLPGVGSRTAERFVFALLKSGKKDVGELTVALKAMMDDIKSCERCTTFSDQSPCPLCADTKRQQDIICVVATPQDVEAFEKAGVHTGVYHVLRGTLDPSNERHNQTLKITELFDRVTSEHSKEVILALNPDLDGETTMMYLERRLKEKAPDLQVTRLARGLPMGSDVQYADEVTLKSAFDNRRS